MKYMVLAMVGIVIFAIILYGEYAFEDPAYRAEQRRIAEQTLVIVGTQEGTMMALQATVEAAVPIQTQFVAVMREQDLLLGTQDAILSGTIVVPPTATQPDIRPTAPPLSVEGDGDATQMDNMSMSDMESTANSPVSSANFADITTASDLTDNGCASDRTTEFTYTAATDGPPVYVVTRARNVAPGMTFRTRWYPTADPMQPYESITWTADTNYTETCVYFWIEPTDIAYRAGNWTIELIVNNTAVQTQNFTFCQAETGCD